MKHAAMMLTLGLLVTLAGCKSPQRSATVGCATCIYHMKHVTGCKLAVKLDGKPYLVDGSGIDDHGNAHASDGLCNAERKAIVDGRLKNGRFAAKRITILDEHED